MPRGRSQCRQGAGPTPRSRASFGSRDSPLGKGNLAVLPPQAIVCPPHSRGHGLESVRRRPVREPGAMSHACVGMSMSPPLIGRQQSRALRLNHAGSLTRRPCPRKCGTWRPAPGLPLKSFVVRTTQERPGRTPIPRPAPHESGRRAPYGPARRSRRRPRSPRRAKHDDLIGMTNLIDPAVGRIQPKWTERPPSREFVDVVGPHGIPLVGLSASGDSIITDNPAFVLPPRLRKQNLQPLSQFRREPGEQFPPD